MGQGWGLTCHQDKGMACPVRLSSQPTPVCRCTSVIRTVRWQRSPAKPHGLMRNACPRGRLSLCTATSNALRLQTQTRPTTARASFMASAAQTTVYRAMLDKLDLSASFMQ